MEENKEIQTPVTQESQKPQEAKKEKKQKAPKKPFNFNKVKRGGVATAALNGANEAAVGAWPP